MIIGLVIVFGLLVGFISYKIYGSGYGLWSDMALGVAGSVLGSFVLSFCYTLNYFNQDTVGFNWYSLGVGMLGATATIYGGLLFRNFALRRINRFSIEQNLARINFKYHTLQAVQV